MARMIFGLVAALAMLIGAAAMAATPIGSVARVVGAGQGTVEGVTATLVAGRAVHLGETIETGAEARLEIAFDDGTVLTVGERARVTLDDFLYRPAGESRLAFGVVGAFRFVSGSLGAGATRQASVATPFAVIGLRGTDFWGGPIDGVFGVVVIEGAVSVTAGGTTAILDAPGAGADVAAAGSPPGPVSQWAQARIDRAIATVTFP